MILLDFDEYNGIYKFDYTLFKMAPKIVCTGGILCYVPFHNIEILIPDNSVQRGENAAKLRRML